MHSDVGRNSLKIQTIYMKGVYCWKQNQELKTNKQTKNHGYSPRHGWVEKQNKTKYKSSPSPCLWLLLKSVSLGVICAGQGQALSSPLSHQMQEHSGHAFQ